MLSVAVALLVAQLAWPSIVRWWRLPVPGEVGFDQLECRTLSREFLVYLPSSYNSRQLWPLVVYLHGSGDRGNDPHRLINKGPLGGQHPAIIAAPQCLPSYAWEPDSVAEFVQRVASTYAVDRQRIYLVGYSMGGQGAWQTAAEFPELFAAIVPIAGGGEPQTAKSLVTLPIWAFHGATDNVVSASHTENMIHAVREAGGKPKMTILPGAGHGICKEVCVRSDLWEWLFAQRR